MDDPLAQQKTALRKQYRALRNGLGESARTAASRAICDHLAAWDVFQRSQTILTYMPIRSEVDLTALFAEYPHKRWVLPRIVPAEDHAMFFHLYDAQRLVNHSFGMAEPAPDCPRVDTDEIQLTLVPGLAYDRHGVRLGYGGGYYDRFLRGFGGVSAGVVFHALLADSLPRGAHDMAVGWVVTERGPFRCDG